MYVHATARFKGKASATAEGGGIHEHQRHRRSRHPVHPESQ
jgi:hypothetical protein